MKYYVKKASLKRDKNSIIEFWNSNRDHKLDEKFDWIYTKNPDGYAIVFLLKEEQTDKTCGIATVFPRFLSCNEKKINAAFNGDLFIEKKHRTLFPAILLLKSILKDKTISEYDLICSFPNRHADILFKRLKYKKVGDLTRYVRVIKTKKHLSQRFNNFVALLLSPLLDLSLYLKYDLKAIACSKKDYIIENSYSADNCGERIFKENIVDDHIYGLRQNSYMRWKFYDNPIREHKFLSVSRNNEPENQGYIVYAQIENGYEIRDISFPKSERTLKILVHEFIKRARKGKAEVIEFSCAANSEIKSILNKFGIVERKKTRSIYIKQLSENKTNKINLDNGFDWMLYKSDEDS